MNIQQQIASYVEARKQKSAVLDGLVKKSAETGESFDAEQQKQFDEATTEIDTINKHIERLRKVEAIQAENAKAVTVDTTQAHTVAAAAATVRGNDGVIAVERKLEKGIGFARFVKFMALAKGNPQVAVELAKNQYPNETPLHNSIKMQMGAGSNSDFANSFLVQKTAVPAAITTTANFAGSLVQYQDLVGDFVDFLRPGTILGKLRGKVKQVPFKSRVKRQTGGVSAGWVGEGKGAPLTSGVFDTITLDFTKLAAVTAIANENLRLASPNLEMLLRDDLAAAIQQTADSDFIDPNNAGTANVKPASILNSVSSLGATTGTTTVAGILADVQILMAPFIAANIDLSELVWIMTPSTALSLSMIMTSLGQQQFPGVTPLGGTFVGLPVVAANAAGLVGASDGGHIVALVHAPSISVADDGIVAVDASTEASLEMSDAPSNSAASGTGASVVSMFQTDSTALKATYWLNWVKRRTVAAQYMTAVHWGGFPA